MKARQANKIVRAVGFHAFRWEWYKGVYSWPGGILVGTAPWYMEYRWSLKTIENAFKHRTIYPPRSPNNSRIQWEKKPS
jgi:hypothetical protein